MFKEINLDYFIHDLKFSFVGIEFGNTITVIFIVYYRNSKTFFFLLFVIKCYFVHEKSFVKVHIKCDVFFIYKSEITCTRTWIWIKI